MAASIGALLLVGLSAQPSEGEAAPALQSGRYFPETGFTVSNDRFWDFFQKRGGLRTFGYPISRAFLFQALPVQFFQRAVLQLWSDGSVHTLNLLDDGLLPYTTINGSVFPAADPAMAAATPLPSEADYDLKIIAFVRDKAPDVWNGLPVNFFKTFTSTVTYGDAFPNQEGPASLVPLLNLEIWGAPTSAPTYDPNNRSFVYQRFQRSILHYDDTCRCTQGLLLADYLKSVMTGENLPADLAEKAKNSPLYRQLDSSKPNWVARPKDLANTNLTNAFDKETPGAPPSAPPVADASATPTPETVSEPIRKGAYRANSPEYGLSAFLLGHSDTTDRDLKKITDLRFGWVKLLFPWREIEGGGKGQFDWEESDRVVKAARAVGLKIIARLDFQPGWARRDGAYNGPPDNYSDYADFVGEFVSRYKQGSRKGTVDAVEIWNEVNLDREWGGARIDRGSAADYVRLLRLAYRSAKSSDPAITVVSAGLSPTGTENGQAQPDDVYLKWMYDAGAKQHFDVLAANANVQCPCVDAAPGSESGFSHDSFYFRRVEQLRTIMENNGDSNKQVWLMEFGWTTDRIHRDYSWYATTESRKSDLIVKAFQFARQNWAPWIGVMTLWTIADPSWGQDDEQVWWAITNPDGSTRPAYDRIYKARRDGTLP